MVNKMSKLAITLLPGTEALYKCCQSLLPVLLVERLQPVLLFALNHCCQSRNCIFICSGRACSCHVACKVESLEEASSGIDEEITQWLQEVNDVLDGPEFAPGILTERKVIGKGLLGQWCCGTVEKFW